MAKKTNKTNERVFTRQDMGSMFCVRPEHFDKNYRPLIPADLISKDGRRVVFKAGAVRAILDSLIEKERTSVQSADGDPLLMGSGDSPALEKYRTLKAAMLERDLRERDAELVDAKDLDELHNIFIRRFRSAGEQLTKQCGNEAQAILDEALDDIEHQIKERFGSSD